jgi:hypothetical protein
MLNYQRVSRLEVLSFIVVVPTFSGWMPDIGTQYICLFCLYITVNQHHFVVGYSNIFKAV